ncbi:MAG: DUF885 domain-containing protein [Planctomycetes bacterium]|nr:DUF885 domain-containing protein [Planctomycetota bacterium]
MISGIGVAGALLVVAACGVLGTTGARGQERPGGGAAPYVPDLSTPLRQSTSELRDVVERWSADRGALLRRYPDEYSSDHRTCLREFGAAWRTRIAAVDFDALGGEGRIDYVLLVNRLGRDLHALAQREKLLAETAALLPFSRTILDLADARGRMESFDPEAAASTLARLCDEIDRTRKEVEAGLRAASATDASSPAPIRTTKILALRAAQIVADLDETLRRWFVQADGYDPLFSWWVAAPYKKADQSLQAYRALLREKVVGIVAGDDEPIVGDPIGRDALCEELAFEMIPYAPEDLIAIAEREFGWCESEMKKASHDMGFGDDWKAALEKVKTLHVEPGRQADLVRDLAREAVAFLEDHDLVTVPPLAKDVWRLEMMSPEGQKTAPFFLGGEVIRVSFPTDAMAHDDKMMSLRGNNIHFSRATVFHELIPGHHLQQFMTERYNTHRQAFSTPFWTEGWALYWEMLMWDLGYAKSPENRVGMLFWRMHRCARILFSLGFHTGKMTPEQCIDLLVERVGHERANATAEVRRSFNGSYGPLYQIAYMIGGLQFRALHHDLVDSGRMTNRAFHDAILQGGDMPVDMVRAMLTKAPLTRDYKPSWKFAGD